MDKADDITLGMGNPFIERVINASILFADDFCIRRRELIQHGERLIGGSPVNDNMLNILVCLPFNTKHGLLDGFFSVIEGGDD